MSPLRRLAVCRIGITAVACGGSQAAAPEAPAPAARTARVGAFVATVPDGYTAETGDDQLSLSHEQGAVVIVTPVKGLVEETRDAVQCRSAASALAQGFVDALADEVAGVEKKKLTFMDEAGATKSGSGCLVMGHLDNGVVVTAALMLVSSSVASTVCVSKPAASDEARLRGKECAAVVNSLAPAP